MNKAHRSQLCIVTLALLLTASTALAGDVKVMSGWECRDVSPGGDWKRVTSYSASAVPVASVVDERRHHYVVCPLVRDKVEGGSTTGLKSLVVTGYRTSSGSLDCTAYTVGTDNKAIKAPVSKMVHLQRNVQTLTWTSTELGKAAPDAIYFVRCLVGVGAGIISVRYEE